MIVVYTRSEGAISPSGVVERGEISDDVVWIDLLRPTPDEEHAVERALGIEMPTREEMREIEVSSRLYQEGDGTYMTATVMTRAETEMPESAAITFILAGDCLVTLRYNEPQPFTTFAQRCQRQMLLRASGEMVLVGLLEAVVDRVADILELVGADVDRLSHDVFASGKPDNAEPPDFNDIIQRIGRDGDLTSKSRESLVSLTRMLTFVTTKTETPALREAIPRIATLSRDVQSLADHATFLSGKVNFLLDATLGMLNIAQTDIIKIFSVAAVVFLPPTLIASIYGMNFEVMPELGWPYGYPVAIVLMVVSAVLPYVYFKHRRWL
ncbi:MAG TPA: magnesium transporter CorA family protein [Alphaproteobacteria bacterium]|jgi:magnesium transporter|nr:magnesium transporter CorA family protein [Alphaproteobacteria bacterium]